MSNHVISNPVPEWDILDSTKIKDHDGCPRKFFFLRILGWEVDFPDHTLYFGQAMHIALEHLYRIWKRERICEYRERDIVESFGVALDYYRKEFAEHTDDELKPKNPENLLRALLQYADRYNGIDVFEVVHTEISGSVLVGENRNGKERKMYFRLDTVIRNEWYRILEHKSSKWSTHLWVASMQFSVQVGIGNHILHCIYGDEAEGLTLNGIFFRNPPELKQDGSPRANASKGNEFLRIPRRITGIGMQDWLLRVNRAFDDIERDMELLEQTKEMDSVMEAFPRRDNYCCAFNRVCEFHGLCTAWPNPLKHCHQCPPGFRVRHWNPMMLDTEHTTKVEL